MTVVMTSTNSPQADLDHAVSEDWREPQPEPKAEPEVAETVEETPKGGETPETKAKGHKGGGILKRVDKLTAINARLEKENEELRSKVKPPEIKAPEGPKEPKRADYGNDVEKYIAARDAWKDFESDRVIKEERRKEMVDTYNKGVSDARGRYDDWGEVVSGAADVRIPPSAPDAILELENGPDVAYYLAQHPEEAKAMFDLTPTGVVRAVTRISDKLTAAKAVAPKAKEKPKPPAPLATVGNSATRSDVSLDQIPIREYIKVRNKQERENRQR